MRAVEAGEYTPDLLSELGKDTGDLGQLSRMLDGMARGFTFRDNQLRLLRKVIPLGVSLAAEKDFNRLLETLALVYCQTHRELIEAEAEADKRYLQEKGYSLEPPDLS